VATAEALPESVLNPYETPPTPIPEGEAYLAQRNAKLFHGRDCSWARRIAEPERVYFKRVAEAREAGYAACPVCEPWEPAG
jgi:methylphosphotriester-DNA--protein-cysteine methyltransferase